MVDQPPQPRENKLKHPCFPQPGDTSLRVWRYLDLAKLIWLLENKKLYLTRLDLLNDPHEGSTPRLLAVLRDLQLRAFGAEQLVAQMPGINQESRRSMYVNCWHIGNGESEAMWRLYCPSDSGVAIQTTYGKLVDSIESVPYCYIGCVNYIDYELQGFPLGNVFYPVMHKRISFAHEHEVRLVKTLAGYWGTLDRQSPSGTTVDWFPETTVDAIYVNPYAPDFYHDVVKAIVHRIAPALESQVFWSQMRAGPIY
jgi:hypothetical protein